MSSVNLGTIVVDIGGGNGGTSEQVALLSITTAPEGEFAVGSKYYNSSTKKIVTSVTADTWTGATSADPVFNTKYTFNNLYYIWDGDNLVSTDVDAFIKGATVNGVSVVDANKIAVIPNASNTVIGAIRIATDGEATTGTLENVGVNPKQLKDGLDSVSRGSNIPFSIKSANIGDKGEVDLFNISTKIVNSGCSFTGSVATGGSGKYVRLLETAPISTADSWVINVPKYYYNGGGTNVRKILGASTSKDSQSVGLYVNGSDKLKYVVSSSGVNWDIVNDVDTEFTLTAETNYWFRLSFSSTTGYKIEVSTDGTNYTSIWTSATTTKAYSSVPFCFLNDLFSLQQQYSAGTMDFSTGSIVIDGTTWWTGNVSNSLSFKVDDGTSYAPLKVINPSGEEVTLTSISALDLSGFADGIINIFATATGAVARQNNIYMQTEEPVAENDGDVWIKGNEVFDWDNSESEWVTSTVIAILGSIIKNGFIENGYCFPLNYNGKTEMSCTNYVSGNLEIDIIAKSGFKFFGRYKNYLAGSNTTYKHPTLFFAFYDTSYSGIYAGGTTDLDYASYVSSVTREIFGYYSYNSNSGYVSVQGYITI